MRVQINTTTSEISEEVSTNTIGNRAIVLFRRMTPVIQAYKRPFRRDTCLYMLTDAVFAIAKEQNCARYTSVDDWTIKQ